MRRLPDAKFFLPDAVHERRREARVDDAVAACRDVLVVSHKKCLDGVGSYLVHALAMDVPPPVVYGYPGDIPLILERVARNPGSGRTLSINDLSLDRDQVDETLAALDNVDAAGWNVVWRDHHHKQWEGVDQKALADKIEHLVVDTEAKECGTSLAQQDLLPDDPLARELADIVRDRDLWWNKDPRSERYEFALRHLGTDAFVDRYLATRDPDAPWIAEAYEAAQKETDEEVEKAVLATEVFGDDGELGVVYGDVPKNVTLHRIREVHGTRMEINLKPEGRFSVRSAKGTDVCHLLAQAYGGGGHPNAAGGKLTMPPWEWPAYWVKGGLSPAGMSVVRTALRVIADEAGGPSEGSKGTKGAKKAKKTKKATKATKATKPKKAAKGAAAVSNGGPKKTTKKSSKGQAAAEKTAKGPSASGGKGSAGRGA